MIKVKKEQLEDFNNLKEHFFYEQKIKEIALVVLPCAFIFFLAEMINYVRQHPEIIKAFIDCMILFVIPAIKWTIVFLIVCLAVFFIAFAIYRILKLWIDSNWMKAEHRAAHYMGIKHKHGKSGIEN